MNKQRAKNGKPAIYLRLTVGNKRIELATQQYIENKLWDQKNQCAEGATEIHNFTKGKGLQIHKSKLTLGTYLKQKLNTKKK